MASKSDALRSLVELYGIWDAYKTVRRTCTIPGFGEACEVRRRAYLDELARYARRYYPRIEHVDAMSAANADVMQARSQLTIF